MGKSRWGAGMGVAAGLFLVVSSQGASRVEITPLIGFRDGGHFTEQTVGEKYEFDGDVAGGLLLAFDLDGTSFLEVSFISQATLLVPANSSSILPTFEIDIDDLQVGGHYMFGEGKVRPFVRGTLGITRLDPTFPDTDDEYQFSFGLGGGVKTYFNDHLGLRLDARLLGTTLTSSEIFCIDDACLDPKGTVIFQGEVTVGLILAF